MRAQIQTAVGMILTLTIVAAVLVLGTWGFISLSRSVSSGSYDRFFDSFEEASVNYRSFGSRQALRIAPPEAFCVFNTSATATCVRDYSGYERCDEQRGYWLAAGPQDGNVVFESGRNERIEGLAPRNGRYACFSPTARIAFLEGHGSYVTVSPMRELRSFTLTNGPDSSAADYATIEVAFFTSQPQQEATPELFYAYNGTAAPDETYERTSIGYDVGSDTLTDLKVELDSDGVVTIDSTTPPGILDPLQIPQLD